MFDVNSAPGALWRQADLDMASSDATCNLAQALYRHSRATPQALAISSAGRCLTYDQLARQAAGLAARLRSSPGWAADGTQPRVGILASRSADACVALLGASWAGASYVPLGLKLPEERILTILSLCRLSAIIADEQGASLLSEKILEAAPPPVYALGAGAPERADRAGITWLAPETLAATAAQSPAHMPATDTAYIMFTSGTTGIPKGVMIAAGAIRHYIETVTSMLGLRASDRALETCELTFDVSLHNMFTTWEAGASLHVLPAARVMNAVRFAREHALTVWNSVPSLVGMLRQVKALGPAVLPGIRLTCFGGEQLSSGAVEAWRVAAPQSVIHNFYGPTEATVYCLSQQVGHPTPLTPGRDVVAIGTALPGSEAAVLDGAGNPVADNAPGELAPAGVQLAIGYLNAPELTNARFPTFQGKRWYLTGDLARRDAAGTFHWLGRMDNQIKVLGHRVELEEVDAHLRIVADAELVATVAWPLSCDGAAQGLVAFIGARAIDNAGIVTALKGRVPHYMMPAHIFTIEKMPLNSNGKVDRKALRQLLESGMA